MLTCTQLLYLQLTACEHVCPSATSCRHKRELSRSLHPHQPTLLEALWALTLSMMPGLSAVPALSAVLDADVIMQLLHGLKVSSTAAGIPTTMLPRL